MKQGRPTSFTPEIGDKICRLVADGKSLLKISKLKGMPSRVTIHSWLLHDDMKDFLNKYEASVNIRTENMFDFLTDISDTSDDVETPARSRLRVDTRKWYLSKIMPKKYGDKLDVTTDGKELPQPLLYVPADNIDKTNSSD